MSQKSPPIDWDKMWTEYNNAVKAWMSVFESFQESTKDVQTMCNNLMSKALNESDIYSIKQFTENGQKSMSGVGFNPIKQFSNNWQNIFFNKPAMEQLKLYGDMMKKFSEDYSWYEMWNKNLMTNTKKKRTGTARKLKKTSKRS